MSQHAREISSVPRDNQQESRISYESWYIHPDRVSQDQDTSNDVSEKQRVYLDRVSQVQDTYIDVSDLDLDSSGNEWQLRIVQHTMQFIRKSRREWRKLDSQKQSDPLSKTRLGKISMKPLSKKQRQHLQSIGKPTMVEDLETSK